jgi:magnesium transporter
VIVDCAAYRDGKRAPGALGLDRVAEVFGLHPLAAEDAMAAHDLPKLEAFGSTLLLVLAVRGR